VDKVVKKYHLNDNQQEIDVKEYWDNQSLEYKIEILESLRQDVIKLGLYPNHYEDKQRLRRIIRTVKQK
jgi:antitoxin component YwqK of YwqJK toxin-antitoxin module